MGGEPLNSKIASLILYGAERLPDPFSLLLPGNVESARFHTSMRPFGNLL